MKKHLFPLALLAICYAIFFAYLFASYASLPPRVASHFGIDGRANGWMSRELVAGFSVGLAILLPGLMVGMMAGAGKIPVSLVNLPHRNYWLAPERRRETSSVLLHYALWFACPTVLFATGMHALIVEANSGAGRPHLNGTLLSVVVGGFLLGTILWTALLLRRFGRKPEA